MWKILILLIVLLLLKVSSHYYKLLIPAKLPKITNSCDKPKHIIYRKWNTFDINQKMYENCHQKWFFLNNNISMIWHTTEEIDIYMSKQSPDIYLAYRRLIPLAFKTDLWRLCILYENGGIYVDAHTKPYASIDYILDGCIRNPNLYFISVLDPPESYSGIHNGFLCCSARHPFIKASIDLIVENVSKKLYTYDSLGVTGPLCLKKAINIFLGQKLNNEFKTGWNEYGDMSFYLYKFKYSLYHYIYKDNTLILSKKHCILTWFKCMLHSKNYTPLWENRQIYDMNV